MSLIYIGIPKSIAAIFVVFPPPESWEDTKLRNVTKILQINFSKRFQNYKWKIHGVINFLPVYMKEHLGIKFNFLALVRELQYPQNFGDINTDDSFCKNDSHVPHISKLLNRSKNGSQFFVNSIISSSVCRRK